ncbi:hypothetical protein BG61_09275 [Caballeronia glathei]|jgi:hypothetical protein|uniref:Uncharacterized protein n=1 Tax=Caballeronia glathei TaxID=60547 RepID=A0A069PRN4_9BURK|nr:hypothetical protein BG61_09275 [Caballeronia glathei]
MRTSLRRNERQAGRAGQSQRVFSHSSFSHKWALLAGKRPLADHLERVVAFDSEISDRAFKFCTAE